MELPHTPYTHGSSSGAGSSSTGPILNTLSASGSDNRGDPEEGQLDMVPESLFAGLVVALSDEEVGDMGQQLPQPQTQQQLTPRALEKSVCRQMYPRPSISLSSGSNNASSSTSSTLPTSRSTLTRSQSRLSISQVQEGLREQHRRALENSLAETGVKMELMGEQGSGSGQRLGLLMNTLAEQEVDMMIQQERQTLLTKSTVTMYERYQRHWVEWCHRKGYPDINVFCKKFQRYMAENIAEEHDPVRGIEPLRVNPKVRSQQQLPYDPNLPLPSYETVDAYIKAVIDLYVSQKSDSTNKAMQNEPHPRSAQVRTLMKKYQLRMAALKKSVVSTDLTFDEGNDLEVLRQTMRTSWTHKYRHLGGGRKHDLIGLRTRLNAVWSHYMVMRGENMRMATLADLATHTVNQGISGGQDVVGISLSMLRGKTNREGKENKGVIVRSKDVEVCPVGAFVLYLFELWMHPRNPPDFNDHSWSETFILFAGDPLKQMSHSSQYRHAATMWNKSANPTNKPTHAHRGSEARHALAAGADIASIAQAGHWSVDRVATHYLDRHSAQVALKMAGCTLPGERLWLARNTVIPPVELQRQVFPFIEHYFTDSSDWLVWTSNIMMDRDIFENRPSNTRMKIHNQDIPKLRILLLLTHLRKVLLQDAAVLINLRTSDFRYGEHHIFRDRLFGSAQFLEFQERLAHSIENTRSPVSDSLAANAPAINHEFRSLHMRDEHNSRALGELLKATSDARNELNERLIEVTSSINTRIDDRFSALVNFTYDISSGLDRAITKLTQKELGLQGEDQERHTDDRHLSSLRKTQQDQIQLLRLLRHLEPGPRLAEAQQEVIRMIGQTQQAIQPQGHQLLHTLQPRVRVQRSQVERRLSIGEQRQAVEQERAVEQEQEVGNEDEYFHGEEQQPEILQEAALPLPNQEHAPQLQEELAQPPQPDEQGIEDQLEQMEEALAYPRYKPPFISDHIMLGRDDPLREQWKEWFSGVNGQPSLWQLNRHYRSKWRKGSDQKANTRSKQFYFKRQLIRSVLKIALQMPALTLELKVEAALKSVEERLQTLSMNRFVKNFSVE